VQELAGDGIDVTVACRVSGVSRSGYYEWKDRSPSARDLENEMLLRRIEKIHADPKMKSYGSPRVHAELTLGMGLHVNEKRVARLMRQAGIQGLYFRPKSWTTVRDPDASPWADLVNRQFEQDRPNRLWLTDITEHRTGQGKLYCAAVMDAYSRRIIGYSMADHLRTELVLDALSMAINRRPPARQKTILHSDHGTQYTSWDFGQRLRKSGLLGSMGSIGDCYDNAMMESFWGTLQLEILDRRNWETRDDLANAIFEWIECWYNSKRRHSSLGMRSPIEFEKHHTPSDDDR
jgi:putative transposase